MIKKLSCLLFAAFVPLFFILCVGQSSEVNKNQKEQIQHIYDSLELKQIPTREVKYSCRGEYTIRVNNQGQFDKMPAKLIEVIQKGERNVKVIIKKGIYYYPEDYLSFDGFGCPDADIRIEGKNVTIVPKGYFLKNGDEIPVDVSGESCYLDMEHKNPLNTWGNMMYADELVEVLDLSSKLCRLKCNLLNRFIVPEGNMVYIDLTRWCRCYQYKVQKIENGYVYFYANDLEKDSVFGSKEYNVNYDYVLAKATPRFRLCNVEEDNNVNCINNHISLYGKLKGVHLANASTFLSITSTRLNNLTIQGVTFLGSKPSSNPQFYFRNATINNIEFSECTFIGQRGKLINLYSTDNLFFHNNIVRDNYDWGIETDNLCSNTYVVDNYFENNGTNLSFNRCVTCCGKDYYIARNSFKNFGYCAISLGVWYGSEMVRPSGGVVEYNHIWYDDEHFNNAWKYTIMDSGAIYLWTQNSNAVIRYNYIHDYTGMRQNRGIYCDDGAKGFVIYGNVIINVPNCHAIDSRRVVGTETAKKKVSKSVQNNINNVMMYNVTDGTLNFVGNEMANNGCLKGQNFLLREMGAVVKAHDYRPLLKNLEINIKDEEVAFVGHDEKGIIVPKDVLDVLTKIPCYEGIQRYVRIN